MRGIGRFHQASAASIKLYNEKDSHPNQLMWQYATVL